jgi:Fic family protein
VNSKDFQNSTAGKCLPLDLGYCAFLPNPLPPKLDYDSDLVALLSHANWLLGELSGTGRILPNPYLLISPYMRREAVSSSRIEGTQASLNDLFFFEAAETDEPEVPDVKEVRNYVRAIEHGLDLLNRLPVSIRLLLSLHEILMEGVRGEQSAPGQIRRVQNWIGPKGCLLSEATYVPPPVPEMEQALYAWEKYYHSNPREPSLIQCAIMHYQFEAIHPFSDGNGRIGRLLITLMLCEKGILGQPLLYLSKFFEKNREEYWDRLLRVSKTGAWRGWVDFFLRGVASQAEDALSDAQQILQLHDAYLTKLRATRYIPQTAHRLIDEIFMSPVLSIAGLARRWDRPFVSVQRGVDRLVEIGILREVTDKRRNRLYVASDLLTLLSPPPLTLR